MLLIDLFENIKIVEGEIYDIKNRWVQTFPVDVPVYENPSKADIAKIRHGSKNGWLRWMFIEGDLLVWDADKLIHSDVYRYFEGERSGPVNYIGANYIGARTGPDGTTIFDGDFGGENRGTYEQDIEYMDKQVIFKRIFPNVKWKKS